MIYLKRFLYILIVIILCALMIPIILLFVIFIPIGMIISFVIAGDFTRYFNPLTKLEEHFMFISDKLESIFLK